ncbi:MAG: helix-turn-helix domain-containing protein, partial [Pseudomonadales bacterium]|nr:helix-turn-helix domain-containing protein [Pseudomonadales bacterium]
MKEEIISSVRVTPRDSSTPASARVDADESTQDTSIAGNSTAQNGTGTGSQDRLAGLPINKPASMGALLRASREARQLSLHDVSAQTQIALEHIAALEADKTLALPQPFVRGYAKSYAMLLGIEPEYLDKLMPRATSNAAAEATTAKPTTAQGATAARKAQDADSAPAAPGLHKQRGKKFGFRNGSSWSQGLLGSPDGLLRAATTTTVPLLLMCLVTFAYHAIDSEFDAARDANLARSALGQTPDALGTLAHEAVAAPSIADSTRLTVGAEPEAALPQAIDSPIASVQVADLPANE